MELKPLAIDLYCGLGGWAEGFLAEGYRVIGFDIERHDYGTGGYPGELILQDILKLHGRECADADVIVGSSPCQRYSYMAMPWRRAKELAAWYADPAHPERIVELNALYDAQFRIQREASEVAGRYIPLIVENVRGAQQWVGHAKANFGSYFLWGDVGMVGNRVVAGALRFGVSVAPVKTTKRNPDGTQHGPGSWGFAISDSKNRGARSQAMKVPGIDFNGPKAVGFNVTAAQRYREEFKQKGSGAEWFDKGLCTKSSKSNSRKAASALIAKIPFPLAQHIARVFKPQTLPSKPEQLGSGPIPKSSATESES